MITFLLGLLGGVKKYAMIAYVLLCLALAGVGGWYYYVAHQTQKKLVEVQTQFTIYKTKKQIEIDQQSLSNQSKINEINQKFNQIKEDQDAKIKNLQAVVARSDSTISQLRTDLKTTSDALRKQAADSTDPSIGQGLQTGATAVDLLGICSQRYTAVAYAADQAIIKGQQCEANYEAVRQELMK